MSELALYDQMVSFLNTTSPNKVLPLLSWEFFGEYNTSFFYCKEDLEALGTISKKWDFQKNFHEELVKSKSVIVVTDPELRIVYATKNMELMNGYNPKEVIGKSPKMFQGEDTCPQTSAYIRNAVIHKKPFEATILNYRKDHAPYHCLIKGFPVFNKKGKLLNYIAFEKAA